jgi:hypothetical protein|tara:strand:- start:208 stop:489 length:282 start_codon:yes stop_codon:yes gene_type:complete
VEVMKIDPRYSIQESKMFLESSISPVVKVRLSDRETGLISTGYGDNSDLAKENAFTNLKMKEEKYLGKYFSLYDAKGKTISGNYTSYKINQKV